MTSPSSVSPVLVLVLAIIGLANLIPLLVYLDYKRRLHQNLRHRRNSDDHPSDVFNEERDVPGIMVALSTEVEEDKDCDPEEQTDENGSSLEFKAAARAFVAEQEQILMAASRRSRWNGRNKGYGVLGTLPPSAAE